MSNSHKAMIKKAEELSKNRKARQSVDKLTSALSTKAHFKPPRPTDAPTGTKGTKGDELLRRLRYEFEYDPIKELVLIAQSGEASVSERIKIASEFLSYYQPKVKPIELNPNEGEVINVNIMFPDVVENNTQIINNTLNAIQPPTS